MLKCFCKSETLLKLLWFKFKKKTVFNKTGAIEYCYGARATVVPACFFKQRRSCAYLYPRVADNAHLHLVRLESSKSIFIVYKDMSLTNLTLTKQLFKKKEKQQCVWIPQWHIRLGCSWLAPRLEFLMLIFFSNLFLNGLLIIKTVSWDLELLKYPSAWTCTEPSSWRSHG